MQACSFLPAATQMIYDMQLQHLLAGVTFECPAPALLEKQIVVHCELEGKGYSSAEIDEIFSKSKAEGKSLYYVDEDVLQAIAPDVVFTQDTCDVCQIDTATTARAVGKLPKQPTVLPLAPSTLREVCADALRIGKELQEEAIARAHVQEMKNRMSSTIDRLRAHRLPVRRVALLEWMEPLFNCGHWIPDQLACAGGVDMLSNPGGDSIVFPWEKLLRYDPEVLVVAPCGFSVERAQQELQVLAERPGWSHLRAVQSRQVYLADASLFTQPSLSTLVDGISLLAALFHPEHFEVPAHLKHKSMQVGSTQTQTA